MPKITKKCPCGCDEKHLKITINNYKLQYFTDCGNWWIKFENSHTQYSYSPCQGFKKYKKENDNNGKNY